MKLDVTSSIRTSPIKVNLVAEMIRDLKVQDAINQLTFSKKELLKLLKRLKLCNSKC